jgi:DNA-binding transcriptional MerR regulator
MLSEVETVYQKLTQNTCSVRNLSDYDKMRDQVRMYKMLLHIQKKLKVIQTMKLILAFCSLLLISSSVSALEKTPDAVPEEQSDVESIASWLAREEGLPLEDVRQALSSPSQESEQSQPQTLQKREDQEMAEESVDENAIESNDYDDVSNAGNTFNSLQKRDEVTKEDNQEVAEESVDENALESDDATDIENDADEKIALSKRGLSVCGCGGGCGCRPPKKIIKTCIIRPARRFTVIHQTNCIHRFVPRVRVAKVYRRTGGHCGCRRPVCIGKLIVVDRGCRVDVFLRTTRRSTIIKAPFLLKTKHRYTTCRFNHWNTGKGFLGHHSFGCGRRHGKCGTFGYGHGLSGGKFLVGNFYNQKHF